MTSAASTLIKALRTLPFGSVQVTRANLGLAQSIRHHSTSSVPTSISRHSLRPFCFPTYITREYVENVIYSPTSSRRTYATHTPGRLRKYGRLSLQLAWVAAVLFSIVSGIETWHRLHPSQLAGWPTELRQLLVSAGTYENWGWDEDALDALKQAWNDVRIMPEDALNPYPFIKFSSVAICLADALERDHQGARAYKVLTEAVDLYEKFSSFTKNPPQPLCPELITERRRLISIFLKLASLSESNEPGTEGLWLSRAIHEVATLLPLGQNLPWKEFDLMIKNMEDASNHDAAFSAGILGELTSYRQTSMLHPVSDAELTPDSERDIVNPESNPSITMEVIVSDDYCEYPIHFPSWNMPDVASAIAIPFEHVGLYAEKHGHRDIALIAYDVAFKTFDTVTPPVKNEEATVQYCYNLIRMLRLLNRRMAVYLQQWDEHAPKADWMPVMHAAEAASDAANGVYLRLADLLKIVFRKNWRHLPLLKVIDLEWIRQISVRLKLLEVSMEKYKVVLGTLREEVKTIDARVGNIVRDVLQRAMESRMDPFLKELEMRQANLEKSMDSQAESPQVTDPTEKS